MTGTIGCGGMGIVYAAEHALLGRPAAIKVLQSELSKKQEVVARFFNEARASTAIRHPGIIEIYDFGWTPDGAAYLVMERLEGETLSRRSARAPLHWPEVLAVARQIAGALGAAHAKGIVHRDLKPDNIFLVPDPEVSGGERIKLLDFGIAKLVVDSPSTLTVTQTGAVIGTPTYMAPEQCRGVAVDHRADLYSLGCVIYELCCGRPPFRGEGTGDVLAAHIYMPPPAMSTARTQAATEIPEAVEALVRRLLAKAPGDRLQSAEEVIFAIDAVRGEPTITIDPPVAAAPALPEPVTTALGSAILPASASRARVRRWVAAASAGGLVVAAAVALLVMHRGDDAVSAASAVAAVVATPAVVEATVHREAAAPPAPPPASEAAAIDVTIDSAPAGAAVVVAGEVLGTTPFRGQIPTPDHDTTLVLRLAGHVDRTIALHPGEPIHARVTLHRKLPPVPRAAPAAAVPPKQATDDRDRSVNPFD